MNKEEKNIDYDRGFEFSGDSEKDAEALEYLQAPEPKISDPEFYNLIKNVKLAESSDSVEEKIMVFYEHHYRYKILRWKTKIKIREWLDYVSLNPGLKVGLALTSIVLLCVLGTITHHQYQTSKNTNLGNLISNQQSPIIKASPIVKPSPESTPIFTPNNIAENNKPNNDDKLNTNIENRNKQKEQNKPLDKNDDNLLKNNELENKVASNSLSSKNNTTIKQASRVSRTNSNEDIALSQIQTIYISDLIEPDLREELKKLIKATGKFGLRDDNSDPTKADATLKWALSQPNLMILRTTVTPIIWKKLVEKGSPKQKAESIVSALVKSIENSQKPKKD